MLILAIPKSASTALLETLGQLHGCHAVQTNFFDLPVHRDYSVLARFHHDQHELTGELVETLVARDRFHKNHIVPTPNNQALLAEHRKVILLREPRDVVLAYRRAIRALDADLPELTTVFADCETESDWLERAGQIGLLSSLEKFCDGWLEHSGSKLVIWYEELIAEPTKTVNRVEDYLGLPTSDKVDLVRARYTRSRVKNAAKRALSQTRLLAPVEKVYKSARGARGKQ